MINDKIREYFKENKLKRPISIRNVGPWANGEAVYAVSCGILNIKHYAVYIVGGEIHSVRERGV